MKFTLFILAHTFLEANGALHLILLVQMPSVAKFNHKQGFPFFQKIARKSKRIWTSHEDKITSYMYGHVLSMVTHLPDLNCRVDISV